MTTEATPDTGSPIGLEHGITLDNGGNIKLEPGEICKISHTTSTHLEHGIKLEPGGGGGGLAEAVRTLPSPNTPGSQQEYTTFLHTLQHGYAQPPSAMERGKHVCLYKQDL